MLITKPNKERRKKLSISIMNIDAKMAGKLPPNDIQLYLKNLIHHGQWGLFHECKNGSLPGNLLIRSFISKSKSNQNQIRSKSKYI